MYIEYCAYSDLTCIINHHAIVEQPVPEPLVWHIFESLVNVGLLMEQGDIDQAQPGWIGIIHRDLKPSNVFVDVHPPPVPARNNWAGYPTIKLGDYGHAFEIPSDDDDNPAYYVNEGTRGFQAPEQVANDYLRARDQPKLTDKTNVFGVGITVMSMMSRNPVGVKDWAATHKDCEHKVALPQLTTDAVESYSLALMDLVYSCVEYNQADRPSFAALRRDILRHTRGPGSLPQDEDLAIGMRASTVQQIASLGLNDRYAVGANLPP